MVSKLTDLAGLSKQPIKDIPFRWWSAYSSPNATDDEVVDNAWDAIAKDFGVVAVDHKTAKKIGAPSTMDLPSDPTKGIYVVEAYHSLHCLVSLLPKPLETLDDYPAYRSSDDDSEIVYPVCAKSTRYDSLTPYQSLL